MAKYDDLAKEYSKEIEQAKALKSEHDRLVEKFNSESSDGEWPSRGTERAVEESYSKYVNLVEDIRTDIEAEYAEVPYAKPRQQGIKKFFKKAGL